MMSVQWIRQKFRSLRELCLGSYWFYLAAGILFWEPDFIKQQVPAADFVFDIGNVVFLGLLLLFYVSMLRTVLNRYDITLAVLGILLIVSTLHYSGFSPALWKCLKYEWPIAAMVLLIQTGIRHAPRKMIRALYHMYAANVVINFILWLILQNGLYMADDEEAQFWLGNENVFIVTMLACLCCGYLYILLMGKKLTADYVFLHILCVLQLLIMWSVTSMIGILIYTVLFLFQFVRRSRWFLSLRHYILIWIGSFFFFTVFRLHKKTLKWLIKGILHKSLSLTKRTKLWKRLLKRFRKHPVLGYGVLTPDRFRKMVHTKNMHWVHAHNYILELLIKGGLLGIGVFFLALFWVERKLASCRNAPCARIITITLASYMAIFCGDCFEMRTPFYVILTLGYVCPILCETMGGRETHG